MGFIGGTGSKILYAFFRFMQLASAVIVVGLVGRYLSLSHDSHTHAGSRLIYAEVLAGISIIAALILFFPWIFSFWAFPWDIIMFIMWIVAFGVLAGLSSRCSSSWYRSHWGFLYGGFFRRVPVGNNQNISTGGSCNKWRTVLAFAFIGAMFWLFSAILGAFLSLRSRNRDNQYSRGTQRVPETTQPVVTQPVVNRTEHHTTQGGPAYVANRNDPETVRGTVAEPGYVATTDNYGGTQGTTTTREAGYAANSSNIGTNAANLTTPGYGLHSDGRETTLGTARDSGLGTARDSLGAYHGNIREPGYVV